MQWLAELCVKRPVFATVLILSLTVVGAFCVHRSSASIAIPKVDLPTILVTTVQPGAAPEQIETEVTDKIEEAVNTISGIDELRSTSSEGVSQVIVGVPARQGHRRRRAGSARQGQRRPAAAAEDDPAAARRSVRSRRGARAEPRAHRQQAGPRHHRNTPTRSLRRQLESLNGVGQVRRHRRPRSGRSTSGSTPIACAPTTSPSPTSRARCRPRTPRFPAAAMDQGRSRSRCARAAACSRSQEFGDIVVKRSQATRSGSPTSRGVEDGDGRRRHASPTSTARRTVLLNDPPPVGHQHRRGRQRRSRSGSTRLKADAAGRLQAAHRPRHVGVHRGVDPQRRGAPHRRLDSRGARRAALPDEPALDDHRGDRDPDVDHRDVRPDLVHGLHAQHR